MQKRKNKILLTLTIIALCISFLGFLISLYVNSKIILKIYESEISLSVESPPDFGLDSEKVISFGELINNSYSQRTVYLQNNYRFPVVYNFETKGNISKFLIFEKEVPLEPGKNKSVTILAVLPPNQKPGNYYGYLDVVVKRDT